MGEKGVTLIETVLVILMVLILSAIVIPRLTGVERARVDSAARTVAADIRYAQSLAISTRNDHRVVFTAGGTYQLQENSGGWQAIDDPFRPGANDYVVQLGSDYPGVIIDSSYTVRFNSIGEPVVGGGGSVSVSESGMGSARTISVAVNTGRVKVN